MSVEWEQFFGGGPADGWVNAWAPYDFDVRRTYVILKLNGKYAVHKWPPGAMHKDISAEFDTLEEAQAAYILIGAK